MSLRSASLPVGMARSPRRGFGLRGGAGEGLGVRAGSEVASERAVISVPALITCGNADSAVNEKKLRDP